MAISGLFARSPFDVRNHYLNGDTADVFFICGNDEIEERVPAHKILLAGSTDAFDKMFYGALSEGVEVKIVDATSNGFRQFLSYFYFTNFKLSLKSIEEVMYLAKKYLITSYFDDCCKFLSEQNEAEGILIAYEQSIRFQLAELQKKVETSIEDNADDIFPSEYFASIDHDFLKQIIQIPAMRLDFGKIVFDGCISWALAACKRANMDTTVKQNLRDQLGDCFQYIKFTSMTLNDIAECVEKYGDLLTLRELQHFVSITVAKCPRNTNPTRGVRGDYEISKLTDVLVKVSKGWQEKLQFIPKKRSLLNGFLLSECSDVGIDGEKRYLSIFKNHTDKGNKILLHTEIFPFNDAFDLKEAIFLEPKTVYSIEIQFLCDMSYLEQEITHLAHSPIEILPETDTKLISTLDLYVDI